MRRLKIDVLGVNENRQLRARRKFSNNGHMVYYSVLPEGKKLRNGTAVIIRKKLACIIKHTINNIRQSLDHKD